MMAGYWRGLDESDKWGVGFCAFLFVWMGIGTIVAIGLLIMKVCN